MPSLALGALVETLVFLRAAGLRGCCLGQNTVGGSWIRRQSSGGRDAGGRVSGAPTAPGSWNPEPPSRPHGCPRLEVTASFLSCGRFRGVSGEHAMCGCCAGSLPLCRPARSTPVAMGRDSGRSYPARRPLALGRRGVGAGTGVVGLTARLRLEAVDVVPALSFARELRKVAPASVLAFLESRRIGELWRWDWWGAKGAAGVGVDSKRPWMTAPRNRAANKQTTAMPAKMTAYFGHRVPGFGHVSPPSHSRGATTAFA